MAPLRQEGTFVASNKQRKRSKKNAIEPLMPAGVPANALYANRTELTNDIVKKGCGITVSSVLRILYFGIGILMGIAAIVCRVFFHVDTLITVLVLLLGLMTVWQGSRLPMESARSMISQLMKAEKQNPEARTRVTFATETEFGVVLPDGKVRTYPWKDFSRAIGTMDVTCLTTTQQSVLFILDNKGFLRGTPGEFAVFLKEHVKEPARSGFQTWCEKVCHTLDNWGTVQAKIKEEDAAKKAAKQAKKDAKKAARKAGKGSNA